MKCLRINNWPFTNPWDWQETGIEFTMEGGDDEEDDFDEGESTDVPIAGKTKTNEGKNDNDRA